MRLLVVFVALALGTALLAGCESTFDKAARARAEAGDIAQVTAVDMQEMNGVTAEPLAEAILAPIVSAAVVMKSTTPIAKRLARSTSPSKPSE